MDDSLDGPPTLPATGPVVIPTTQQRARDLRRCRQWQCRRLLALVLVAFVVTLCGIAALAFGVWA